MSQIFYDGWESLLRTLVVGVCSYVGLIVLLRSGGKRTLAQLNAYDFIVTVSLGSVLATILLSRTVSLLNGLMAFAVLILLQAGLRWVTKKSELAERLLTAEPTLLVFRGKMLREAMQRQLITEAELLQVLRSEKIGSVEEVQAVVLETNGKFSVVKRGAEAAGTTLQNVPKPLA